MNGLIVVNKPANWTSRDVVNKLSHILNQPKIGHTGTLDPLASGLLVCLLGKYTKLERLITNLDKEYIAEIKLGLKTDTLDITGKVIKQASVDVSLKDIKKVIEEFPRQYWQTVPLYSAVKIKGKKLYEYARKHETVPLPKRVVNIYHLELLAFQNDIIKFQAHVSKGTYIRSLIEDICTNLHTYGTMQSLVRTQQGKFHLQDSYTLEQIANNDYKILNVKDFLDYPIIELTSSEFKTVANGGKILNKWLIEDKVIFTYQDQDVAIYEKYDNYLKSCIQL